MNLSTRRAFFALFLSITAASSAGLAGEAAPKLPDEQSALAAAEKAVLTRINESQLPESKPFFIIAHGDIWLIATKPVLPPRQPGGNRQSIIVQLDKNTGEVLDIDTAQ